MTLRETNVIGGIALEALLGSLPVKIKKNILRAAMREGAKVMKAEVERHIPVASGALRKSVRITTRAQRGTVSASVKIGDRNVYYAAMVEYGTKPHLIKVDDRDRGVNRRTGKLLSIKTVNKRRSLQIGGNLIGPSVAHPGSRPRPFARPAADAAFPAAVQAAAAKVRERLTKQGLDVPAPVPSDPAE